MKKKKQPAVQNAVEQVNNGLSGVIMGQGFAMGLGGESQLSQTDTLFKNLRYYLISNMRALLSQLYTEHGIIETMIDLPVEDALRGGFKLKSKQLSEDELQEIEHDMHNCGDVEQIKQAEKWKRLYGGGGLLIITDQDHKAPLDVDAIGEDTPLEFRGVDMWELYFDKQNMEDTSVQVDTQAEVKEKDRFSEDQETFSYYGKQVNKTRVILAKGKQAPSFIRPRLRGWGLSELEAVVRSLNQYLKSTDLSFEVLDEFKLDIFKIKGLIQALGSPSGEAVVQKRLALANSQKNYLNSLAMDADDDYVQKQLSFAGLAEVMAGIRMQIASDLRMPLTKIFGISATGFNSGEDDIENYNSMIESRLRPQIKRMLTKVAKLRCQKNFGMIPDDLEIELQSLRIMSSEQEENVKTQKFSRLIQARQAGELTSEEFRESVNKDDLFAIPLDPDLDVDSLKVEADEGAIPVAKPAPTGKRKTKTPQAQEA